MADQIMFAFNKSDSDGLLNLLGSRNGSGSNPVSAPEAANCLLAVTTSAITARAGNVLGTGTVQAKYIDNANTLQDYQTLNVLNPGSAIGQNVSVMIFRSGSSWLAVEVC